MRMCRNTIKHFFWRPPVMHLRETQLAAGHPVKALTALQMGMVLPTKTHHVTTNSTTKGGPPTFRVRVCKSCCGESVHMELGTYMDQESALLVNDVHEILMGRTDQLLLLRPEDKPFLGMLWARRYHKGKVQKMRILEVIAEKEKDAVIKRKRNIRKRSRAGAGMDGISSETVSSVLPAMHTSLANATCLYNGLHPPNCLLNTTGVSHRRVLNSMFALMHSDFVMGLYTILGMANDEGEARRRFQDILRTALKPHHESFPPSSVLSSQLAAGDLKGGDKLMALFASSFIALLSAYAPVDVGEVGPLAQKVCGVAGWADLFVICVLSVCYLCVICVICVLVRVSKVGLWNACDNGNFLFRWAG
ncbi:unnamed protein product [Choristocarpus tenellus]